MSAKDYSGDARYDGARNIKAPRGSTLVCKNWTAEAAMRMLMNNLDNEGIITLTNPTVL